MLLFPYVYGLKQLGYLNGDLFGEELFIQFTMHVYRERLSVCVFAFFPFCFEGGMVNCIIFYPCLSFYFSCT